jgi:hypothetical protein
MKEFEFYDYITITSPTGRSASNLKEFLSILEECEDNVLFHHLFQSQLKHEIGDYNCDFANWVADSLEDYSLAEKIGNFNPYDYRTIAEAKVYLAELIEEHMWDLPTVPWVRPGFEFYFSYATSIIIPSGVKVDSLFDLKNALKVININSFYFHFCESRKIKKEKMNDDFSIWIEENFDEKELVKKIRDIDFYFFSLEENRKKVIRFIKERLNR